MTKYAYIFDFDGVLARSMKAHFICYQKALQEVGVTMDYPQFFHQAGMTGFEQIKYFADKAGKKIDVEKVYQRKREIWKTEKPMVESIDCNVQLLQMLRRDNIPVAIATGSSRQSITPLLAQHGIEVDATACAEDVKRGKPNPDLFLCAAEKLGCAPEYCIVVEDSDVGVEAAQAAKMKVMRFYDNEGDNHGH